MVGRAVDNHRNHAPGVLWAANRARGGFDHAVHGAAADFADRFSEGLQSAFTDNHNFWLELMGRLRPGVAEEQVRSNLDTILYDPSAIPAGISTFQ